MMVWGWDGMGWDRDGLGVPVEGWALLQAGSCESLPAARERVWHQHHSQRRKLLPSPNTQSRLSKLWQHWHSLPAPAVGNGKASTATLDITQCYSYLHDGSQPRGPALWGTLIAGNLSHIGCLLGTTPVAPGAAEGTWWQQCLLSAGIP